MKYFPIYFVLLTFFACSKTKRIENLNEYYSFNDNPYPNWINDVKLQKDEVIDLSVMTPAKDLPKSSFYVPNSFSPNENNINDIFIAKGFNIRSYSATITNSYGIEVYSIKDDGIKSNWVYKINVYDTITLDYRIAKINFPNITNQVQIPPALIRWDGTHKGKSCKEGFYTLKLKVTSLFGKTESHKMTIFLIKDFSKLPSDISNITLPEELDPLLGKIYVSEEKKYMK